MLAASKRFVLMIFVALAACVAVPSVAAASTQLGQVEAGGGSSGGFGYSEIGYSVAAGPSYVVPAGGGVITSWSAQGNADTDDVFKLRVYHPTAPAGHEYVVVAESAAQAIAPDVVNTFASRVKVQAGDIIGLSIVAGSSPSCQIVGSTGDVMDQINPDEGTVGSTETADSSFDSFKPNVSATLEPDADNDGYGDETQDQCSSDPTTQAACEADLSLTNSSTNAAATIGEHVTYTIGVKNNSAYNAAKGVVLSDALPAGMTLVSVSGGSCNATTCAIGDLAKGASATLAVVARASGKGPQSARATVSSQTPDPNAANNSASVTTTVLARFSGLTLRTHTVRPDKHGRVHLTLRCPAAAVGRCVGADTLKTAGKVVLATSRAKVLTLGKARFSVAAGKSAEVTIKLSKRALALLASKRTIKARQTVVAHDSRHKSTTRSGALRIKKH